MNFRLTNILSWEKKPATDETDGQTDAPAAAETSALPPENTEAVSGKTLVVYFSATGTTKAVAERIAAVTDADIYEIIPAEPYSAADFNRNDSNSRTTIEMNDPERKPA